ncbi:MAG TPA: HAMP domain-containing sensor histidine kinase [Bacillota bacterium]|nr:HAMP domain-containing sensor histidine kinase [Bacillota bacterium]
MRPSLRLRLPLTLLILISLTAAGAGFSVMPVLKDYFLREREQALLTQGSIIANAVREELLTEGEGIAYIARSFTERLNSRVLIVGRDATVIADAYGELQGTVLDFDIVRDSLQGRSMSLEQELPDGTPVLYILVPIARVERLDGGQREIFGAVFISNSLVDIYTTLQELRQRLLLGAGLVGLLAALAGLYLSYTVSAPLGGLLAGVRKLESGVLGVQIRERGDSETRRLARAFNTMSTRMAGQEEARRRFVSDASHEMRTPLAATKALIEPILSDEHISVDVVRELMQDVDKEIDRLSQLVEDLLQLAQLDTKAPISRKTLDLAGLLREAASTMMPLAAARGVGIELSGEPLAIAADEGRLYRAVLNLIDNAVKHAESTVRVDLTRTGRQAEIRISDDGPGIKAEHQLHLFERFFRADDVRNRGGARGSGLGLAITREIVELHDGRITVVSSPGAGATFVVTLPLTQK